MVKNLKRFGGWGWGVEAEEYEPGGLIRRERVHRDRMPTQGRGTGGGRLLMRAYLLRV